MASCWLKPNNIAKKKRATRTLHFLAPTAGLEPATSKLTASCSTIELRRNTLDIILFDWYSVNTLLYLNKMKSIIKIIRYSWVLKRYYLATMFFAILISMLNQVTPFALKFLVDGIVEKNSGSNIDIWYIVGLLAIILVVNILIASVSNFSGYLGDILSVKLRKLLTNRYYAHILTLPMSYFDNQQAGKITSRLDRSISTVSELVQAFANDFVGMILTSVVTIAVMFYYSWPLAIMLAVLFPFYIWITSLSSKSWQRRQEPINSDTDISKARFIESVGQIRVVKSFNQEKAELNFMSQKLSNITIASKKQSKEWHWYDVARRAGLGVIFAGIYSYIILQTWNGNFTLGTLTLLFQLALQAQFPLFASSWIVESAQRASSGSKDYFEAMDTTSDIIDSENAIDLNFSRGEIKFENVDFAYQEKNNVLKNVSFVIEPNTKLALVGESGEGKTTIANLILRFYETSKGTILIDKQDISKVTQASLRDKIGVVFQEPALFSGTVRENISYGKPGANTKEIEAAAEAANATDFINKLPEGLDTEIGERGVKLSGGQKQRIAIARAILKDAPILILDEATSSLDSKAEHEVQEALKKLMHNRTTIIIAHRLSTIASVDKIIGLRNGKVIEEGSPAELAKGNGIYAELLELQNPTDQNKAKLKTYDINAA